MEPFQSEARTLYGPNGQTEMSGHGPAAPHSPAGIETSFQSAGEVTNARHFFAPAADIKAAPGPVLTGLEHTTTAAAQAANQAISPLIQLIMRLPTHVSLFGSFFEAIKNFFLPNTDFLSHLANVDLSGLGNINHSLFSMANHNDFGLSAILNHSHIFQNMTLNGDNMGLAQLHLNPADSLKHSMNLSAGADLQHAQFETLPSSSMSDHLRAGSSTGDSLAGPGISSQSIEPHMAEAERIFSASHLESASHNMSNSLSSSQNSITSNNNLLASNATGNNNAAALGTNNSINQMPSTNTSPVTGLHAKALSFANFSHSQHLAHSTGNLIHPNKIPSDVHKDVQSAKDVHAVSEQVIANHHHKSLDTNSSTASVNEPNNSVPTDADNMVYTIKQGDTLWRIAANELGDGSKWKEIYSLNMDKLGNDPSIIHSGTSIHLPQGNNGALPDASQDNTALASQSVPQHSAPQHYMVKPGDNLWRISQNFGGQWQEIYKLNSNVIGSNPSLILPGQKLDLLGQPSSDILAHHSTSVSNQIASATNPDLSHVSHTSGHYDVPKSELHAKASNEIVADKTLGNHTQAPHSVTHAEVKNIDAKNTLAQAKPSQINSNSNNGLSVQSDPQRILSGAGGAQASNVAQNPAISKAINNLVAGKAKSVVSFSLAPDLSFLDIRK